MTILMTNPKMRQTPLVEIPGRLQKSVVGKSFMLDAILAKGTLEKVGGHDAVRTLRKYSITTLEEVIAIARVRPKLLEGLIGFDPSLITESKSIAQFGEEVFSPLIQEYEKFERYKYAFGASVGKSENPIVQSQIGNTSEPPAVSTDSEYTLINDCMPPIRDQGERWTCVAFATCAVVEYAFCREKMMKLDLSEQFQYWNCKQQEGNTNNGTYPEISFALANRDGICKESTWQYNPRENPANPIYSPPPANAQSEAANYKVRQAVSITQYKSVHTLKQYITSGNPIAFVIPVYDSWEENGNSRSTGNITLPLPGEEPIAGHSMVLVGYEDNPDFAGGGYFVVRNSWGTNNGAPTVRSGQATEQFLIVILNCITKALG